MRTPLSLTSKLDPFTILKNPAAIGSIPTHRKPLTETSSIPLSPQCEMADILSQSDFYPPTPDPPLGRSIPKPNHRGRGPLINPHQRILITDDWNSPHGIRIPGRCPHLCSPVTECAGNRPNGEPYVRNATLGGGGRGDRKVTHPLCVPRGWSTLWCERNGSFLPPLGGASPGRTPRDPGGPRSPRRRLTGSCTSPPPTPSAATASAPERHLGPEQPHPSSQMQTYNTQHQRLTRHTGIPCTTIFAIHWLVGRMDGSQTGIHSASTQLRSVLRSVCIFFLQSGLALYCFPPSFFELLDEDFRRLHEVISDLPKKCVSMTPEPPPRGDAGVGICLAGGAWGVGGPTGLILLSPPRRPHGPSCFFLTPIHRITWTKGAQ